MNAMPVSRIIPDSDHLMRKDNGDCHIVLDLIFWLDCERICVSIKTQWQCDDSIIKGGCS